MTNIKHWIVIIFVIIQVELMLLYYQFLQDQPLKAQIAETVTKHPNATKADSEPAKDLMRLEQVPASVSRFSNALTYKEAMEQVQLLMEETMHRYDRTINLPLLVLRPEEKDKKYRVNETVKWLRTQRLAIGASVRNAMGGLEVSVKIMRQLSELFNSTVAVFVENESTDRTRSYLYDLTKQSTDRFKVILLGCGTVNSANPCRVDISYRSGRKHVPGNIESTGRSLEEESVDRGLTMAALRNIYLNYFYKNTDADLLLVLESDMPWDPWNMDDVTQGLYYFKTRPQLDSLCALTYSNRGSNDIHDPCTLTFFHNRHFYVAASETAGPFLDRIGKYNDIYKRQFTAKFRGGKDAPVDPVKVASCFQGATFYRMSSMRAGPIYYKYAMGEWNCEHTTVSNQLKENYLDMQMRKGILN